MTQATFTVTYTAEQAADELIGPAEIAATAADTHELTLTWQDLGGNTVAFTAQGEYDADELANLLRRLQRRGLQVAETPSG